jgi:prepilin-type N-terminal cleavage/methylation domain-containing protein
MKRRSQRGVTLMEVLIAVTLLALLSVAMLTAMRVGLNAFSKAETKLMDNRRMTGAHRIIQQEVAGLVPVIAVCKGFRSPFFQGEPTAMRFVSTFSLGGAWRGAPHILEMTVIPGDQGKGVRLIVNEVPYSPTVSNALCLGNGAFPPVEPQPGSFILADRLAFCRFRFLAPALPPDRPAEQWIDLWRIPRWPLAVRIEMGPLVLDPSRPQPLNLTVPIHVTRDPDIQYVDQ